MNIMCPKKASNIYVFNKIFPKPNPIEWDTDSTLI